MKKYLYAIILFSFGAILFMSNRGGRGTVGNVGSTGAPGDDNTVCQSCHNGQITVALNISILDGTDTVSSYSPGKEYTVHVRVNHTGGTAPKAHGFQIVALKAPLNVNGSDIKTWSVIGTNAKIVNINGRQYVEHNDRSVENLFQMKWIAPVAGSGPVSFYTAGNGVNSNNTTSGDGSARASKQLNEKGATAIAYQESDHVKIYPNPASDKISLQGADLASVKRVAIKDLFGKTYYSENFSSSKNTIDISNLYDGVYFLMLYDENQKLIRTNKLVKRQNRA